MNQRMAGNDRSLNVPLSRDGEGNGEWQDWLEDDGIDQETSFAEAEEFSARQRLMMDAIGDLNEREQRILQARRLAEPPLTLEDRPRISASASSASATSRYGPSKSRRRPSATRRPR